MKDAHAHVIDGPNSLTKLITYSPLIRGWYNELQGDNSMSVVANNLNMSYAPHRFDSVAKPLSNLMFYWPVHLALAQRIARERRGTAAGTTAEEFLVWATPFHILLLGLMAQAAYEGLLFTRVCDAEKLDAAMLAHAVRQFIKTITTLFVDGRCFTVGFGAMALDWIKKPVVFWQGKTPIQVGDPCGASEAVKAQCLAHLAGWVKLAILVAEAEFPHFETINALQLFNLDSHNKPQDNMVRRCCAKLALAYSVDPEVLQEEHDRMRPLALREATHGGLSTVDAWQSAFQRSQGRADVARGYPCVALLPVLQRYVSLRISTGGCERALGLQQWLASARRSRISPAREEDELTIASHKDKAEEDTIFKDAVAVWMSVYGFARKSRKRLRGWKHRYERAKEGGAPSQAAWLRAEERRVADAVSSNVDRTNAEVVELAGDLSSQVWTDKHEAEATRQKAMKQLRVIECADRGTLLADELGDSHALKGAQLALQVQKEKVRKAWAADRARKDGDLAKRAPPALRNLSLHVPATMACIAVARAQNDLHMRTPSDPRPLAALAGA